MLRATATLMSSALSLAIMGLSSRDRSGAHGTSGFFEAEVVADDDLGRFVCVDPEG